MERVQVWVELPEDVHHVPCRFICLPAVQAGDENEAAPALNEPERPVGRSPHQMVETQRPDV